MQRSKRIVKILNILKKEQAFTMLGDMGKKYDSFKILISTILSARSRDEVTYPLCEELFKKYPDAKQPGANELERILSFFKKQQFFKGFYSQNLAITKKSIKNSVKDDLLIIQAINTIADIDRVINTLVKRLRDWYGLHNPEFPHVVEDHADFVAMISEKKDKKVKDSMGADLSKDNLKPIMILVSKIKDLFELRKGQEDYLEKLMKKVCPNLLEIAGATIGAKLVSQAGSLRRLVTMPSSTIQLLGAEKAFFRHLKTGARSPKYGFLHEHPLLAKSKKDMQGKVARSLADKISIAVRVDYFKGKFIGGKLRKELEKKFAK
jgi:nucleolar protein 56